MVLARSNGMTLFASTGIPTAGPRCRDGTHGHPEALGAISLIFAWMSLAGLSAGRGALMGWNRKSQANRTPALGGKLPKDVRQLRCASVSSVDVGLHLIVEHRIVEFQ